MKIVKLVQSLVKMKEGKILFYTETYENNKGIRVDIVEVSMDYYTKVCTQHSDLSDEDVDALILYKAFSKKFNEYFELHINGKNKTPERKPYNVEIKQQIEEEAENCTLEQLFELLEKEENNFKKLTGILRITAKLKTIIINEIIEKRFNELEEEQSKYERGLI